MGIVLSQQVDPNFWIGKRVFLTGHTGFKGSWLSLWLSSMGANVYGYSLAPSTKPNLFSILKIENLIEESHQADIVDSDSLQYAMQSAAPDIVIHMAAQALVRDSYNDPVKTYNTNVMGTVHLLEAVKVCETVRATIIITSDKCYENKESDFGYKEEDPMGGHDPYSSSKGCAELVTSAYIRSYFSLNKYKIHNKAVATARAGNVIGGGDWSNNRIIPDAVRAFEKNQVLKIRNPLATRPWQHVLEPLSGYLILAQKLFQEGPDYSGAWNFGPKDADICTVNDLITKFIKSFKPMAKWEHDITEQPYEANILKLDCTKVTQILGWNPKWNLDISIENIARWYQAHEEGKDMQLFTLKQISSYQKFYSYTH